jgi:chitinase
MRPEEIPVEYLSQVNLAFVYNFPRMMDILQTYLQGPNRYSKKFGLSITVPTSYWYLRWFDLYALEPYVDEFNLMAYLI